MDNFEEYIRQGEPNKAENAKVWKTAIGLQQVDGLKPSDYLIATAKQNILCLFQHKCSLYFGFGIG